MDWMLVRMNLCSRNWKRWPKCARQESWRKTVINYKRTILLSNRLSLTPKIRRGQMSQARWKHFQTKRAHPNFQFRATSTVRSKKSSTTQTKKALNWRLCSTLTPILLLWTVTIYLATSRPSLAGGDLKTRCQMDHILPSAKKSILLSKGMTQVAPQCNTDPKSTRLWITWVMDTEICG